MSNNYVRLVVIRQDDTEYVYLLSMLVKTLTKVAYICERLLLEVARFYQRILLGVCRTSISFSKKLQRFDEFNGASLRLYMAKKETDGKYKRIGIRGRLTFACFRQAMSNCI